MFWNVQGAASKSFYRTFVSFCRNYNPSMVVILEPRISGLKADHFIKKSGFDRSHRVEAIGFSGGIWLLWKEIFEVGIIMNNKQFVHFKITKNNGLLSWVTAVYASPVPNVRRFLWNYLGQLVKSIKAPWLVGGDFNYILYTSERRGTLHIVLVFAVYLIIGSIPTDSMTSNIRVLTLLSPVVIYLVGWIELFIMRTG